MALRINAEPSKVRKPKVLLVRPPAYYYRKSFLPSVSLPLGLLYIAAVVERNGCDVVIYDALVNRRRSFFDDRCGRIHVGDTWDEFEDKVKAYNADIVGLHTPFAAQYRYARIAGYLIKKALPDSLLIAGGHDAGSRPKDFFIDMPYLDMICVGEGEETFPEIIKRFTEGASLETIDGTILCRGNEIYSNAPRDFIKNIDSLPFPAYHLINLDDYFYFCRKNLSGRPFFDISGRGRAVSMITSRGCPFSCVFCSIQAHMGVSWRCHSAEYVLNHLEFLINRCGIEHVHFEDDNLTFDAKRFENILNGMQDRRLRMTWDTPNGVRADSLTRDIVRKSVENGCLYFIFGVESGSQRVLDCVVGKKLDLRKIKEAASWCRDENLDAMAFFVIGFPSETKSEMQETIDFARMLEETYDIRPLVQVATPLPGTRLEKICLEKNILTSRLSEERLQCITQGFFCVDMDILSADEIQNLFSIFFRENSRRIKRVYLEFIKQRPIEYVRFFMRHRLSIREREIFIWTVVCHRRAIVRKFSGQTRTYDK